jgi:hypothetical protein
MNISKAFKQGLIHPHLAIKYLQAQLFRKKKLSQLTNASSSEITRFLCELRSDFEFYQHIKNFLPYVKGSMAISNAPNPFLEVENLYVIVRALKPQIILETGVASGLSSAFLLKALDDNDFGTLYSIDLPNLTLLPPGKQSGWIIPEKLTRRWKLIIGKSTEVLEQVLEGLGNLDIFLHDSGHTYQNMLFEFRTAWKFLRKGGILLSDDYEVNTAFMDFQREVERKPVYFFRVAGLRKDT